MGIRLPVWLLVAACVLPACSKQAPPPRDIPVYDLKFEARSSGTALVTEGDTLGQIANRYALTINDIIRSNMLAGNSLQLGQRLVLPPPRTYTVRAGDSIDRIARMFDTDVQSVAAANNLYPPYTLQFGQTLNIPQDQTQETVGELRAPQITREVIETEPLGVKKPDVTIMAEPLQPSPIKNAGSGSKFIKPLEGRIVSDFGPKPGGLYNDGINIAAKTGTPVSAAKNGTVAFAGEGPDGFGNMVLLKHEDGYFTVYAHLSQINVSKGASISNGEMLGRVGATGNVKEPQLHFEIRQGTKPLDPVGFL